MPSAKPLIALRLSPALYADLLGVAERENRAPSNFIEHHLGPIVRDLKRHYADEALLIKGVHPNQAKVEKHLGRPYPGRQLHLEDAIAAAVKRGPVKAARHK